MKVKLWFKYLFIFCHKGAIILRGEEVTAGHLYNRVKGGTQWERFWTNARFPICFCWANMRFWETLTLCSTLKSVFNDSGDSPAQYRFTTYKAGRWFLAENLTFRESDLVQLNRLLVVVVYSNVVWRSGKELGMRIFFLRRLEFKPRNRQFFFAGRVLSAFKRVLFRTPFCLFSRHWMNNQLNLQKVMELTSKSGH